ncbi:MAG: TolB family protein [Solirubrobacteraceae bacterium]
MTWPLTSGWRVCRAASVALAAALVCLAVTLTPTWARADVFGPISLVSAGTLGGGEPQQAEYAHDAVVSGDGVYVAFDGAVAGVTGVWRRNLLTGTLEQVAGGDAELPSINANGQYLSFTTNEGKSLPAITDGSPDAAPHQEAVNVYVRNMAASPAQAGAFTVASAADGSPEPLEYHDAGTTLGASAAPRSAISADGSEVAFVTTAVSDLVLYPKLEAEERQRGKTPQPHTPADQVAVRYIESNKTVLVSRCYFNCGESAGAGAAEPVVGNGQLGAVYPGERLAFPSVQETGEWPGASISADGSTVAWMGEDIGEQAATLPAETFEPKYTEPLWRRIAPGSETQTERVTGGSDPGNPLCAASGEAALPTTPSSSDPCQGPFVVEQGESTTTGIWGESRGIGDFIPRLSADGYTVAFLSEERLLAEGLDFGRGGAGQPSDLFLADMHPGLTRDQALTPLTEIGPEKLAYAAPIADFEISSDGAQVAFSTTRTQFPLGFPQFEDAPAPEPGMPELFDIDLHNGTLVRVTHGYAGGASEQPHKVNLQEEDQYGTLPAGFGALSPSFAADGDTLVFTSTADNLVYGDGNTPPGDTPSAAPANGSDAFLVKPVAFVSLATPQYVSPPPATGTEPARRLGVTALSRADGSVLLYVAAPSAGTLTANARGALLVRAGASHSTRRSARGAGSSGVTRRSAGAGSSHANGRATRAAARRTTRAAARHGSRQLVATRTVAVAGQTAHAPAGELVVLVLKLGKPYAALASAPGGLSANASVTFSSPGEPALRESVAVSFRRTARAARRPAKGAARSHAHGAARR